MERLSPVPGTGWEKALMAVAPLEKMEVEELLPEPTPKSSPVLVPACQGVSLL